MEPTTYRRVECEDCGAEFDTVDGFIDHLDGCDGG